MDFAIPQHHDAPPKLLWWDFDQALIFMSAVMLGILSGMMALGLTFAILGARWYGRHKARKHRRYLAHALYWYLPGHWLLPCPQLAPSYVREFIG